MKMLLTTVLLALLVFSGCVRSDRFRYVRLQPSCFGGRTATDPVPGVDGETRDWPSLDCRHRDYAVSFVEFERPVELVLELGEAELSRPPEGIEIAELAAEHYLDALRRVARRGLRHAVLRGAPAEALRALA